MHHEVKSPRDYYAREWCSTRVSPTSAAIGSLAIPLDSTRLSSAHDESLKGFFTVVCTPPTVNLFSYRFPSFFFYLLKFWKRFAWVSEKTFPPSVHAHNPICRDKDLFIFLLKKKRYYGFFVQSLTKICFYDLPSTEWMKIIEAANQSSALHE